MIRDLQSSFFLSVFSTVLIIILVNVSSAQVMTSPSYRVQSDSVNVGGGFSSSTSYVQESTLGEVGTGQSDSTTYSLRAGYQQMQAVSISMTVPANVLMDQSLSAFTAGTSTGSTSVNVITDSPSGYQITIAADNTPSMQRIGGGDSIDDYDDGGTPDFAFALGSASSYFGFSPSGDDIIQAFKDNGTTCGVGSADNTDACWDGLSTTAAGIVSAGGANHPTGATTTIYFKVVTNTNSGLLAGFYTATATLTALPL